MISKLQSSSDFAGFIDGFQARNLESIQRETAIHLSEIQTRLGVLKAQVQRNAELKSVEPAIEAVDQAFQQRGANIVDRLVGVGTCVGEMLIKHHSVLKATPELLIHVQGLVRSYFEAAEASRNERITDSALSVVEQFQELSPSVGG